MSYDVELHITLSQLLFIEDLKKRNKNKKKEKTRQDNSIILPSTTNLKSEHCLNVMHYS